MAIDFKKIVKGIFIKEESDPSKGLKFTVDPGAATNTTTTILAEQQTDVTLSLPGETSELLGDIASQDIQNKTIDADLNVISNIDDSNIKIGAAIDASKLADGSVSNAEYQYLANVTSDIQTQLNTGGTNLTNHLNDAVDAHDASAISNVPSGNLAATDQQSANNELQSDIDTRLLKAGDTMSGNLNMGSNLITALATPVSGTDAANKNYVDGISAGLDPKESVRVATTASVGGSYATTPSNGQFTGAATSVDGVSLSVNDRVLIKDQADAKQNGIYVYSASGEFTRSADMDGSPASEVSGGNFVFVAQGSTNGASGYVLIANGTLTLNTDDLTFTQFSGGANSANKNLSNLDAPTSINQSLIPAVNNTQDLGSTSKAYQDLYTGTIKDSSGLSVLNVGNRQLMDAAGNPALTYSSATALNANSRKLSSLANPGSLTDAINKQTAQNYLKNFIQDGDAEGAQILTVYNDSSTTRPVDGTGGTQANLAVSISSTAPLSDSNSFLFTKSGSASTQGSGASIPFTIPNSMKAKVAQIEFEYIVNSGTFVAGSSTTESDVIAYIFDVTNSTLIEPSSIKFLSNSSTISDKFIANFQTSATGTSYRLILHCASTSTANYELKFDNFKITPCNYVYGTPITDWKSTTFTLSNSGNATVTGFERRVGDSKEFKAKVTIGATLPTGNIFINVPSGNIIDTAKLESSGLQSVLGEASAVRGSLYTAIVSLNNSTQVSMISHNTGNVWNATVPATWANGDTFNASFVVPIVGLSSSVQVSDGYDGRQIVSKANGSQSLSNNSETTADLTTTEIDKTASIDLSANTITVKSAGLYRVTAKASVGAPAGVTFNGYLNLRKNGSTYETLDVRTFTTTGFSGAVYLTGSTVLEASANDYYDLRVFQQNGSSAAATTNIVFIVEKLQAPTTMSATEVVAATYQTDAGQSLTSAAVLKFEDKVFDTHNAYNTTTGVYTAPVQGLYAVSFSTFTIDTTTGQDFEIAIRKNSGNVARFHSGHYLTNRYSAAGTFIVSLLAGETIDIYNTSSFAAGTLYSSAQDNFFSIQKIK